MSDQPSRDGAVPESWRQRRVATPEGELWVAEVPSEALDRAPLVLVHGGPGFPSDYLWPLAELADTRPVAVYDQIGVGRSSSIGDPSQLSVDLYVAHLDLVRQAIGADRVVLLGQSWGGFLALAYAAAHPQAVEALILSSPLVDVPTWCRDADELAADLPPRLASAIRDGAPGPDYEEAEAEFYRRHFCALDPWPEPLERSASRLDGVSYEAMWGPNEFTCTGLLSGASMASAVPALPAPSLWITGADDEARPSTICRFAEDAPSGRCRELPGTHSIHLEHPDAYLAIVREFLASL